MRDELPTVREIARWCDETAERRAAVMRQISALQAMGGGKPAMLIVEAQRLVYTRRDRSPVTPADAPRRWLLLETPRGSSSAHGRDIALGRVTLAAVTRANVVSPTHAGAVRSLRSSVDPNVRGADVVLEAEFLELIEDLREIMRDAPDPLAFPTSHGA